MTTTVLDAARYLVETHGLDPDEEYEADAGRDYGLVRVWQINDNPLYLIAYGDNATTTWDTTDDTSDLAEWLEEDMDYDYLPLQTANVRGLGALPEPNPEGGEYRIIISHDYYGGATKHAYACDNDGEVLTYDALDDAMEAAEDMDDGVYVTNNNEIGRPTYTVVSL